MLPDWVTYERVRHALLEQGDFSAVQNKLHKLLFKYAGGSASIEINSIH